MSLQVETLPDPDAVAARAASYVAARARATEGRFTFAVSGGRTPWAMFKLLAHEDMPWERTAIYQVDERVAPLGHPDRNLTQLMDALPTDHDVDVHALPVEADDLDAAAAQYAATLPERFDLIHLGIGPDGHTASLVPGDPVLDVVDRDVAPTVTEYQGRRRLTLTYPAIDRARQVLWLVTSAEKADALRRLRAGDPSIPAGRVATERQLLVTDAAAAAEPS